MTDPRGMDEGPIEPAQGPVPGSREEAVPPDAPPRLLPADAAARDAPPLVPPYRAGILTPLPTPPEPPPPPPVDLDLVTARRLIGSSFDLLLRSGRPMRRASFYVGMLLLGTFGPLAVGFYAYIERLASAPSDPTFDPTDPTFDPTDPMAGYGLGPLTELSLVALVIVAIVGLIVALVESRSIALLVLGGALSGRPVTTRQAVARTRATFWRAVAASIMVWIPLTIAQTLVTELLGPTEVALQLSIVTSTVITAIVGAPLAYVASGVVLGDVDPLESLKRSFRLYRARKVAAVIVVLFETVTALLILLGLSSGLEVVLRVFDAAGVGLEPSAVGSLVTVVVMLAIVFAIGTLIYTVTALTVAPQVVMFLGLTHATFGLDRVRRGGPDDPDGPRLALRPFRWLTPAMGIAMASAVICAALIAAGA